MPADEPVRASANDLLAAVRGEPILRPHLPDLERLARSSIRLHPRLPDAQLPSGASKIGGHPDVPGDFVWPRRRIEMPEPSAAFLALRPDEPRLPADGMLPLEFIAQINLADVLPFDADGVLPTQGHLLFFYADQLFSADVEPARDTSRSSRDGVNWFHTRLFGADLIDQVRVFLVPAGASLHRDAGGPRVYAALGLDLSSEMTLPDPDSYLIARGPAGVAEQEGRVVLAEDAWTRYADLGYETRANANIDQMLGWADCFSHGQNLPPGDEVGWTERSHEERLVLSRGARLLLQLSTRTYEWSGMRFGRTLYFYARETDLQHGDVSGAWYDLD
jgi:uncharacterized protein YwqG